MPAVVHDLPGADASVDLGVSPLTRRQARQQERIRTASVPVITPEVAAAHAASLADAEAENSPGNSSTRTVGGREPAQLFGSDAAAPAAEDDAPADEQDAVIEATVVEDEHAADEPDHDSVGETAASDAEQDAALGERGGRRADDAERAVVNPQFGAELLAGDVGQVELPASFDQLISRSVTGADRHGQCADPVADAVRAASGRPGRRHR